MKGLLSALGAIYTNGYDFDLAALFEGRVLQPTSLQEALKASKEPQGSAASVWIHGAGIRKQSEDALSIGNLPLLTSKERKEVKSVQEFQVVPSSSNGVTAGIHSEEHLLKGYEAYQKTMQQFLTNQESMLQLFLNGQAESPAPLTELQNQEITPRVETPTMEEPTPIETSLPVKEAPNNSDFSRESLVAKMMAIISERTGYPEEMLSAQIDLEAELGIDSIKRMEILDKVLKELPSAVEEQLQSLMQPLMRTKTIHEFMDIVFSDQVVYIPNANDTIDENITAKETKNLTQTVATPTSQPQTNDIRCPRFVMQPVFHELPYKGEPAFKGVYLITADQGNIAPLVAQKIEAYGGQTLILSEQVLSDAKVLESEVIKYLQQHKQIEGIIHCAPLSKHVMPNTLYEWKMLTQLQTKSLFQILRTAALHTASNTFPPVTQILATSLFGGYFGREASTSPGLPAAGGHCGLLKTLHKEWEFM